MKTTLSMKNRLPKILKKEPQRSIVYLVSLILVRTVLQISLYQRGYISVSADEFSRGIRAAQWAENPQINILADVQGLWLPFEKYLNGFVLFIWPDVILAPRVTVFIASSLLIIAIYLLAYYLFNRFAIAALSVLFIVFQPWYVWLSGTPMLEMYYFVCFFAGLLFLIMWLKEERKGCWLWAGLCFLLASGIHVQSWTFINLVNLLTLPYLFKFMRDKNYSNIAKLVAFYVLSNGLVLSFALIEFFYTGQIFAFLGNHTSYSKWFYEGYNVSVLDKFLYYPKVIVQNSSTIIWVYLLIAFAFLVRDKDRFLKLFPLLLAMLALLLNSIMNILSGPPSAAAGRYSLFYVLVLSLYAGYGTYHLFKLRWNHAEQLTKYLFMGLSVLLFLYGVWWGASRVFDYPHGMPLDPVEAGRSLNALLDEDPGMYMIELYYWEFLAVDLTSQHFDEMIFDREQNYFDRNTPSIFMQEIPDVCKSLAIPGLRYVAIRDEALKLKVQEIDLLRLNQDVGTWTIYELVPESETPQCQKE